MEVDIGNYHTEQQVGTIDDEGNLETDSGALEEVARPLIEDGIYAVYPFHADGREGGEDIVYKQFHIEPGMEGFLREFFDALPSPYDCDLEVIDELPVFDADDYIEDKMEKDDFPPWCRSCGENRRMSGSFVCPSCHPDEDEDEYDGALAPGETKEKMVAGAVRALQKEWVQDPSPDAQTMRWTHTETGEHRYQEEKPEPLGQGGDDEGDGDRQADEGHQPVEYDEEDVFGSVEEAKEAASTFYEENIAGEGLEDIGGDRWESTELGEAWAPFVKKMLLSGIRDKGEVVGEDAFEREEWQSSLNTVMNASHGAIPEAFGEITQDMFGVGVEYGHSPDIAEQFQEQNFETGEEDYEAENYQAEIVYDSWMKWSDDEGTSPIWQLAVEKLDNDRVPDEELLEEDRPRHEERMENLEEHIEKSREAFKNTFGEEVPVFRVLDGDIAEDIQRAKRNDEEVEIEHYALESWTMAPGFLQEFHDRHVQDPQRTKDAAVIMDTVSVDEIWGSSFDSKNLANGRQAEVIVGAEGSTTYSPDQVYGPGEYDRIKAYEMAQDSLEHFRGPVEESSEEFENIEDCVEQNSDKRDPGAYCAAVFGVAGEGGDEDEEEVIESMEKALTVPAKDSWYDWPRYALGELEKERVYIDDPSEAPEGAEVHEGELGGLWYDSEEAEGEGGEDAGGMGALEATEMVDESLTLDRKGKAAVREYITEHHATINQALRGEDPSGFVPEDTINRLESLFDDAPEFDEPVTTFRGMGVPPEFAEKLEENVGETVELQGFQSTSHDPDTADIFTFTQDDEVPVMLQISTDKGLPLYNSDIDMEMGGPEEEQELLLGHGWQYSIESTEQTDDGLLVNMEVVSDD